MIEKRGHVDDHDVDAFVAAGFRKEHALEVIAVVAASTITNYTASVTKPSIDRAFPGLFVERRLMPVAVNAEHFPSPSTAINAFVKCEPVRSRTSPSALPGSENFGRRSKDR